MAFSLVKVGLDPGAGLLKQLHEALLVLDSLVGLGLHIPAQVVLKLLNEPHQCSLGLFAHPFLEVDHFLDALSLALEALSGFGEVVLTHSLLCVDLLTHLLD